MQLFCAKIKRKQGTLFYMGHYLWIYIYSHLIDIACKRKWDLIIAFQPVMCNCMEKSSHQTHE